MIKRFSRRTAVIAGLLVLPLGAAGLASGTFASSVAAQPPETTVPVPSPENLPVPPTSETVEATAPPAEAPAVPPTTVAAAPVVIPDLPPAPVLPSNVETVNWAPSEIQAVGQRNGDATAAVQARLLELGFWVPPPDGKYGFATSQAVMAYQKYVGLPASGSVDKNTAFSMTFATEKARGLSTAGTLVEIDKGRQILFLVVDGKTQWAFNTSTGSGIAYQAINKNDPTKIETGDAQTPSGLFRTYLQRDEGWWAGDLGQIYRPKFFNGGIAVHGMTVVPNRPASHGCVRVSTMAMDFIWDTQAIPMRSTVWVHA